MYIVNVQTVQQLMDDQSAFEAVEAVFGASTVPTRRHNARRIKQYRYVIRTLPKPAQDDVLPSETECYPRHPFGIAYPTPAFHRTESL